MILRDDIPSILIDNFKDLFIVVFILPSTQDATENSHYPQIVGEPLRLELTFTFPLKHVSGLIVLGRRMFSVAVDKFFVAGKNIQNSWCFSPLNI